MEEVGRENIFIFGLTAEEIAQHRANWTYRPTELYSKNPHIKRVMDSLLGNRFCPNEPGLFRSLADGILQHGDFYFHLADFDAYAAIQEQAAKEYAQPVSWARKAILNIARMGKFSSDRTIMEYAKEIWKIKRIPDDKS